MKEHLTEGWTHPEADPADHSEIELAALRVIDGLDGLRPNDARRAINRAEVILGWSGTISAADIRAEHPLGTWK